jgi:hypothetical protein
MSAEGKRANAGRKPGKDLRKPLGFLLKGSIVGALLALSSCAYRVKDKVDEEHINALPEPERTAITRILSR